MNAYCRLKIVLLALVSCGNYRFVPVGTRNEHWGAGGDDGGVSRAVRDDGLEGRFQVES